MISDNEISVCPEHEVKSKIGTIFVNEKILEEYSVKIYEIDSYFYEYYNKKIRTDENGRVYILFRIDIYFTKYFLAVEVNCEFIRVNTNKENYEADYEASRIQMFIIKFKDKEKDKIKELEDEIKKLRLQLTNLSVQNNDDNVNDNDKK